LAVLTTASCWPSDSACSRDVRDLPVEHHQCNAQTQYSLGGTELKVLLASSFLGMFVGAAFLGRLADIFGRRRAFMFNLIWFSVWSLIAAFAPGPGFLVVARFLAGIGVGAEYPVADSYLSDVLPKSHRGRLAAWAYTCSYLAVPFLGSCRWV